MNTKIQSFRDLIVWHKGMEIAKNTYKLTEKLPKQEVFGLISQLRRASISIPSNIAEGHSRNTTKDFIQFLYIAQGSLAETQTQLILAKDLYGLKNDTLERLIVEEQKMLVTLIKKLKS